LGSPNISINLFDLTTYTPQATDAIVGCVGPSTKGAVNTITDVTDEGNFVSLFGRPPAARMYAQRAAIRYFKSGNKLKFVRIAGLNLATAGLTLKDATGLQSIVILQAASPGSWANAELKVSVLHNGTSSYSIQVYFLGQLVEQFLNLDNGIVATRINSGSSRMTAVLAPGAGTTFPGQTIDSVTGAITRLNFTDGNDGAFASTDSFYSSTGGVAGSRFYGKMDTVGGSRVFDNILAITPALAGVAVIRGTVGMAVVPGTFTIRVQTAVGPVFVELADNGNLSYGPGGAGVGLLVPAAGAHRGFIDYRTGAWGVQLSGSLTFSGGTVDGIWTRANTESVGATAAGVGAYAGNLSAFPLGVGFFNSNRVVITVPISEQVGLPTGGATTASSEVTLKTLAGWIVPGSIALTPTHPTLAVPAPVYDDGFGGWRTAPAGAGTPAVGTVDYRTGVFSITWPDIAMPAAGALLASYAIQLIDMGGGAVPGTLGTFRTLLISTSTVGGATATSTDVGSVPFELPVYPGSVKVVISDVGGSPFTAYDDGVGGWLTKPRGDPRAVAVTGSITYSTGAWTITPGGAIAVAATITAYYTKAVQSQSRRYLRGTGPQFVANVTPNVTGLNLANPATANDFDSPNFLDHSTGEFGFTLDLITTGSQTFNLADGAALTAVYIPATILGYGDGTTVTFTGTLAPAPFRRQANRLVGFQGAEFSVAGSGDPQVTFAALGTSAAADYWIENVALSTDPDNRLDFRNGSASIKWTGAPLLDEATFVVAEEVVAHVESRYPGDIGNERTILADGLYVVVDSDPTVTGTLRLRVLFGAATVESFGQATTLAELVTKVNDPTNGSDFVTLTSTSAGSFIPVDVGASQSCGMGGAFTTSDVIGTKVGQTYTGMQMFQNDEVVPVDWLMVPGQWHRQVIQGMQTLCERNRRLCIGIVPNSDETDPFQHRNFINGNYNAAVGNPGVATARVPYPPLVAVDSSQLTYVAPWMEYLDTYSNTTQFEPMDGDVAGLVAATPHPWYPIAGLRRGRVTGDQLRYSASSDDRDLLYGQVGNVTEVVNTVIRKEGRGLVLYGQRTCQRAPTALDRINVRWTMNTIMKQINLASQEFLFELNDPILWREAQATLNGIVQPIIEARGLQQAQVIVDSTTNTPDVIDRLQMKGKLFVKPSLAVEDIEYDMILTSQGATFSTVVTG
jgi:hypothetical protein